MDPARLAVSVFTPLAISTAAAGATLFSVAPNGPSGLAPDLLFITSGRAQGGPIAIGGGAGIGAGMPGDNLNAVSRRNPDLDVIVCFGVDDESEGEMPPAGPDAGLPTFSVFDQAIANQQAGDVFLSTEAFNRNDGKLPPPISIGDNSNVLARNQSPDYFADFNLLPDASPNVILPDNTPLDDVDAETCVDDPANLGTIFFCLSSTSPSLLALPGPPSGATIFADPDINLPGDEQLFAAPLELALDPLDDIDALVIHEPNDDPGFDPMLGDFVAFSLAPGSPTLLANRWSPADVLIVDNRGLRVLIFHFDLGLLPSDNLDSLAFVPLLNASAQDTLDAVFSGQPLACGPGEPFPIPAGDRFTLLIIALGVSAAAAWLLWGRPPAG